MNEALIQDWLLALLETLERMGDARSGVIALQKLWQVAGERPPGVPQKPGLYLVQSQLGELSKTGRVVAGGYGSGVRYYLSPAECQARGIETITPRLPPPATRYAVAELRAGDVAEKMLDSLVRLERRYPRQYFSLERIQVDLVNAWRLSFQMHLLRQAEGSALSGYLQRRPSWFTTVVRLSDTGLVLWSGRPALAPYVEA